MWNYLFANDKGKETMKITSNQTDRDTWVLVLDQDERLSQIAQYAARKLVESVNEELYKNRELPLVFTMNHFNLIDDIFHYSGAAVPHNMRLFYNDPKLKWGGPDYHCYLVHEGKEHEHFVNLLPVVGGFGTLHYARLDPARIQEKKKNPAKGDGYNKNSWIEEGEVRELPPEYY